MCVAFPFECSKPDFLSEQALFSAAPRYQSVKHGLLSFVLMPNRPHTVLVRGILDNWNVPPNSSGLCALAPNASDNLVPSFKVPGITIVKKMGRATQL